MMTGSLTRKGRPPIHPIQQVRVRLCGCTTTEPLKAVTFDGGQHWEIISRDPVFRGCLLVREDLEFVKAEGSVGP